MNIATITEHALKGGLHPDVEAQINRRYFECYSHASMFMDSTKARHEAHLAIKQMVVNMLYQHMYADYQLGE